MPSARFGGFAYGWEVGLLVVMVLLYVLGTWVNPRFFGDLTALQSVLRDASRYGVMAVGMTFVIVNRDLDLSVGSTLGLTAVLFSIAFAPTHFDLPAWAAVSICLGAGLAVGLTNGVLVTYLKVPSFIATLTMLFIGRGLVLGLTGGKTIAYEVKAREFGHPGLGAAVVGAAVVGAAVVGVAESLGCGSTGSGYGLPGATEASSRWCRRIGHFAGSLKPRRCRRPQSQRVDLAAESGGPRW